MNEQELRSALRATRKAIRIVRGQGGGGGHQNSYVANVKFESTSFLLQASNLREFTSQCLIRAEQSGTNSIDDICLSFNGAREVNKDTGGWWTTDQGKCNVLTAMILEEAFKQGIHLSHMQYIMTGDSDGQGLFAEGNNIFDLEQSCTQNLELKGSVDDIAVRLNGGQVKKAHTGGWWTSSAEVCRNAVATAFK